MNKKYLILAACVGLSGCISFPVTVLDNPDVPELAVKEIPFGPPMFNTEMSLDKLQQGLAHHQTMGRIYKKRIAELEGMLENERAACSIERNAILNGKMDGK